MIELEKNNQTNQIRKFYFTSTKTRVIYASFAFYLIKCNNISNFTIQYPKKKINNNNKNNNNKSIIRYISIYFVGVL